MNLKKLTLLLIISIGFGASVRAQKRYYAFLDQFVTRDSVKHMGMHSIIHYCGFKDYYKTNDPQVLYRKVYNDSGALLAEGFVKCDTIYTRRINLKKEADYVKLTPIYKHKYYWPNGKLKREGNYTIDETRSGKWIKYNPDGTEDPDTFNYDNEFGGLLITNGWPHPFAPILLKPTGRKSGALFIF